MDKAPHPSGWGLLFVIAFLAFLIWHGPWDGRKYLPNKSIQQGTVDCSQDPKTLTNIQLELCIDIQSFRKDSDYE